MPKINLKPILCYFFRSYSYSFRLRNRPRNHQSPYSYPVGPSGVVTVHCVLEPCGMVTKADTAWLSGIVTGAGPIGPTGPAAPLVSRPWCMRCYKPWTRLGSPCLVNNQEERISLFLIQTPDYYNRNAHVFFLLQIVIRFFYYLLLWINKNCCFLIENFFMSIRIFFLKFKTNERFHE